MSESVVGGLIPCYKCGESVPAGMGHTCTPNFLRQSARKAIDTGGHDLVNHLPHYQLFPGQEAIDIIKAALTPEEFAGYCKGSCLKHRLRAGKKDDIAKADWYRNQLFDQAPEDAKQGLDAKLWTSFKTGFVGETKGPDTLPAKPAQEEQAPIEYTPEHIGTGW